MKLIAILALGVGMMGSAAVQAQQTGQGAPVPRSNVQVAQAGTFTAPGSAAAATAPAAAATVLPALAVMGVTVAGVAASSNSSGSAATHH